MSDKVTVVNMIPFSLSGETNNDFDPNIAVNPANTQQIAGTARIPYPGPAVPPDFSPHLSPIYYSNDEGETWKLLDIIKSGYLSGEAPRIRFATSGGNLYAAVDAGYVVAGPGSFEIHRTNDFSGLVPMTLLTNKNPSWQLWLQAATVPKGPGAGKDRVYVGSAGGKTIAGVAESLDAGIKNPAFNTIPLGPRQKDSSQLRVAVHSGGTVYLLFYGREMGSPDPDYPTNDSSVVICRDDNWGIGADPFMALIDPKDKQRGVRIVTGVKWVDQSVKSVTRWEGDLCLTVRRGDPGDSSVVYVCWGGAQNGKYTLHVLKSTDGGSTWSPKDLRAIDNAVNPALAIDDTGRLGFLYQRLTEGDQRMETTLELTYNDFEASESYVVANTPVPGDWGLWAGQFYLDMMAVGSTFYGIFSAKNTPEKANFPHGVKYQRNVDWNNQILKDKNGNKAIQPSVDPFFFKVGVWLKEGPGGSIQKEIKEVKADTKEAKELLKFESAPEKIILEAPKPLEKLGEIVNWLAQDSQTLRLIAQRIDDIEKRLATGRAFIRKEERPQLEAQPPKKTTQKESKKSSKKKRA